MVSLSERRQIKERCYSRCMDRLSYFVLRSIVDIQIAISVGNMRLLCCNKVAKIKGHYHDNYYKEICQLVKKRVHWFKSHSGIPHYIKSQTLVF